MSRWLQRARSGDGHPLANSVTSADRVAFDLNSRPNGTNDTNGTASEDRSGPVPISIHDDIAERAAIAEGVPTIYREAWARLNCQRPSGVTNDDWQRATITGGLFFDTWGSLAEQWQWTPGDLFDVPRGLLWFAAGQAVQAFGPEHARIADGRVFDRLAARLDNAEIVV